jgi:hypothetical protein
MLRMLLLPASFLGFATVAEITDAFPSGLDKIGLSGFAAIVLWMFWKKSQVQDRQSAQLTTMLIEELKATAASVKSSAEAQADLAAELRRRPCLYQNGEDLADERR